MDIRVLGPLEAFADGTDVTPTSPNQRTVLAVLAAHPDRHVRADTLDRRLLGFRPAAQRRAHPAQLRLPSPGGCGQLYRRGPRWVLSEHRRRPTRFHRVRATCRLGQTACTPGRGRCPTIRSRTVARARFRASWPTSTPCAPRPAPRNNSDRCTRTTRRRVAEIGRVRRRRCGGRGVAAPGFRSTNSPGKF